MPIAITLSLCFIMLAYFGVSGVSTLMWPYYDQNQPAPLSYIFDQVGWPVAKYVVSIGAVTSLLTSLLGSLFPLPRILYAMSSDGLIFRVFGKVSTRTQTPVYSTIFAGLFAGAIAAIFDVNQLAQMMSIGTLLAYTLVCVSVLILRYQEDHIQVGGKPKNPDGQDSIEDNEDRQSVNFIKSNFTPRRFLNINWIHDAPNHFTARLSNLLIAAICTIAIIMDIILVSLEDDLFNGRPLAVSLSMISFILLIFVSYLLSLQPQTTLELPFKVITSKYKITFC